MTTITAQDIINNYLEIQRPWAIYANGAPEDVERELEKEAEALARSAQEKLQDFADMTPAELEEDAADLADLIAAEDVGRAGSTNVFVAHAEAIAMVELGIEVPAALVPIVTTH